MTTKYYVAYTPQSMNIWLDSNVGANTQFVCVTQEGNKYTAFVTDLIV